jgi:hypothetical protein
MDFKVIGGIIIGLAFATLFSLILPGYIAKWMGEEDSDSRKDRP